MATMVELLIFGQVRLFSILEASLAPFIIAPLIVFILLNLLFKLDSDQQKLGYFSSIDAIDPTYHRAYLIKHAEHELSRIKRYGGTSSMLMIDIDDFDDINSEYGYFAGNEVLSIVNDLLREQTRTTDLVGLFDNRDFLAFLPETYCSGALSIAERMRQKIENLDIVYGKYKIPVTASIGIAICNCQTEDIDSALSTAERLLHQAKYLGSNQVVIEQNCSKYCFCMSAEMK
ncbi:MAG: GGDEF domain-containing protein [Methylococcales bacterium]